MAKPTPPRKEASDLRQLLARAAQAHRRGALSEAEAIYAKVLISRPDLLEVQHLLAVLRIQQGRYKEAHLLFEGVLKAKPASAAVLANYASLLYKMQRHGEALAFFDKALAIDPGHALALCNRGNVLSALGRERDALQSYRRAVAVKPNYAEAYNNMGNALAVIGRLAEAEAAYCKALELDPGSTSTYLSLGKHKTFTPEDAHLFAMEALERNGELRNANRIELHFALGKAHADLRDYRRAWAHFLQGNALKRGEIVYDEAAALARFTRTMAAFTPEMLAAKAGLGDLSPLPIFIVGMPRSGTTLIEQVLSSHRDVHGAGELRVLRNLLAAAGLSSSSPESIASVGGEVLKAIGAKYVAELKKFRPDARHVTDKMPQNFLFIGHTRLALPNARIIHVVRNPIDTCISCFSTLFAGGHDYAYDLAELGRYYRHYRALMRHWQAVLPEGSILDVRYEEAVANLEREARRIFRHCALDWDPHCLEFHRSERPVRTASVAQVRRPIFTSAIGRWRVYEPYIEPLLAELHAGRDAHPEEGVLGPQW